MTTPVTLQATPVGPTQFDLSAWAALQMQGQSMAMRADTQQSFVQMVAANRFVLSRDKKTRVRITDKGTAIVEVHGVLMNRFPVMGAFFGMTAYEGLIEQCRRLAGDAKVKRVVLDIDSPGGLVTGLRQASAAIIDLKRKKPVHALAHDDACSAAYWLACCATSLSVTPDGFVGSIGVKAAHVSYARMLEQDGIDVTSMSFGDTKRDFESNHLLNDGAFAEWAYEGERDYDRFVAHVAKCRRLDEATVRETGARTFVGTQAVDAKLADRIETLEKLVERIEGQASASQASNQKTGDKPGGAPKKAASRVPAARLAHGTKQERNMSDDAESGTIERIASSLVAAGYRAGQQTQQAQQPLQPQAQAAAPAPDAPAPTSEAKADDANRIFAILECDEAKGREALARELAKTGLSVEAAKTALAAAPKTAEASTPENPFFRAMSKRSNSANISPDAPKSEASNDEDQFVKFVAARAKKGDRR